MRTFVRGLTAGAVIGAAAGMMMMPQVGRKTRKKIMRNRKNAIHKAEDIIENVMGLMM